MRSKLDMQIRTISQILNPEEIQWKVDMHEIT